MVTDAPITQASSQLFVGQVVLYSDLSPWEIAEVVEIPNDNEVILKFDAFDEDETCLVSVDGIRTINWHQPEVARQARDGKVQKRVKELKEEFNLA